MIRLALLASLLALSASAQSPGSAEDCAGEVYLETQAAVDAFDCDVFDGDLGVRGPDVEDLHGLSELRKTNSLYVVGTSIRDLAGLGSLEEVDSIFSIYYNPLIETLEGLERLERVGIVMKAQGNERLRSVDAFQTVREVGWYGEVRDNPLLEDCSCGIYPPATEEVDFVWIEAPELPDYQPLVSNNAPGCNSFEEAMHNYDAAVCEARRGE